MDCNSGQRKVFADEVVEAVQAIAKKHGLNEVVVERHNPMLIAVRGCLKGDNGSDEPIEMVALLSGNLIEAESVSTLSQSVNPQVPVSSPDQVYRSFDISELVAKDTAAGGVGPEPESPCEENDTPEVK